MFHMWDYGTWSGTGWWFGFGSIWMILVWAIVIALGVWGLRKLFGRDHDDDDHDAMATARKRYARGDITKEEFEQIQRTLSKY